MILLDTVALIWATMDDPRLGKESRSWIERETAISVSAITPWEVTMLAQKGRISLNQEPLAWIEAILAVPQVRLAPIEPSIAVDAGRLPGAIHGDPADRLIIATARALSCPLLTSDRRILDYSRQGHVEAFDARR